MFGIKQNVNIEKSNKQSETMKTKQFHFETKPDFEFVEYQKAKDKLEELYLSEPNSIYNMYRNNFTGIYSLRKEQKSNG